MGKCRTISCTREAETRIKVSHDDGDSWVDEVCRRCAKRYVTYSRTPVVNGATVIELGH